jgi:hypothetical protein
LIDAMFILLLALLSGAATDPSASAQVQTGERTVAPVRPVDDEKRVHYVLSDSAGAKIGEVTQISRRSVTADRDYTLYRSVDGDELVLESAMIYADPSTEKVIRNVKGDAHVTARIKLPFSGKTRDEVLREYRQNPDLFAVMPGKLELATNGGEFRVSDDEFKPPSRMRLTKRVRQVVPFDLLEAIERGSTTILATEFAQIIRAELGEFLLYRPECAGDAPAVKTAVPDCDFDAQFGFPCSKTQLTRSKQARERSDATSY